MRYTPGPWKKEGLSVIAGTRGIICKCPVVTAGGVFNVEANTRLIAASPEMFALLNEWLDTPFFESKEEWREWVEDYRPRVEQALAECAVCREGLDAP